MSIKEERDKRIRWFLQDRFGLFIHWGLYAIPARGEWVQSVEKISAEEYRKYFNEFNPDRFDPRAWARTARKAGMKYAVMTAKHHDGFCLFDSALTEYKAPNTKAARDLVQEFIEAFRNEGLKVGLYYSLIDWHHDDYPSDGDPYHPHRDDKAFGAKPRDFSRYLAYLHGQVRELCTKYGKLDIFWFDFSYDGMAGEKWQAGKLVEMMRSLQPDVLINNRLEASGAGFGSIVSTEPSPFSGDFASPEQIIPNEGITDAFGDPVPWEACMTLNNNWGYVSSDHEWKTPTQVLRKLVECVSKGGNLLLNVGPDARGSMPSEALEVLSGISDWMSSNVSSIAGCGPCGEPKPEWGRFTRNGDRIYAHIFEAPIGPLCLPDMKGRVAKIRLCADGSEIRFIDAWNTQSYPKHEFINFGSPPHLSYPLPDSMDTVLELELI